MINEKRRKIENTLKMFEIQNSIEGIKFLIVQGDRAFVEEAELFKVSKGKKQKRKFWLFTDILIYGQTKKPGLFQFKGQVSFGKALIKDAGSLDINIINVEKKKTITLCCDTGKHNFTNLYERKFL